MSRDAKYEYYQSPCGDWYWHLKAANGKIVASGEGYTRKRDVLSGIKAHRRAAKTERVVEIARPA